MEQQGQYYNIPPDTSVAYGFGGRQQSQQTNSFYGENDNFQENTNGMTQHIQQNNNHGVNGSIYTDNINGTQNQYNDHQNTIQPSSENSNNVHYGFLAAQPHQQQTAGYYGQNENYKVDTNQFDEMSDNLQQTSTQRVAAAMYPEALHGDLDIPSTQFNSQQTAVQRLSEPSQILRHAVVNIINYQDDADLASEAVPELIKLLNDSDDSVVNQATMVIHQLSLKEASRHALSGSSPLIEALIQTLENSSDLDTTKLASEALGCISQNNQGLLAIFKTGGIRALIHALGSQNDAVVFNAMTTLHNLLLHQEGAKINVRLNGGIQKMVNLLHKDIPKFLAIVADCLHILAFGNQEGKLIMLASGVPAELARILLSYHYEKLLFTAARVMKVLSVCPNNKTAIIQANGMQALSLCLNHPSRRLIQECLWTIRNLSDGATKEFNLEPLLQRLVQLLDGVDINIVTCAVGALSNLTCNNQPNKIYVCNIGGVQSLVRLMRNYGDNDEIMEPTLRTLKHITGRSWVAGMAQDAMKMNDQLNQANEPWFDTDL